VSGGDVRRLHRATAHHRPDPGRGPESGIADAIHQRHLRAAELDEVIPEADRKGSIMPILECQKVSKAYGGLLAVSNLSFAVEPGEVYSIVGPNGAGKTSLFDCISGVNPATSGSIKSNDRQNQGRRAPQICRL